MSKWISASIVLLAFAAGTPAQAELFSRLSSLGDPSPAQVGPEVMSAPMMAAPQKYGAFQSGAYPFASGCCEATTPCCGSIWDGFCGCGHGWFHGLHAWFAARKCGHGCGVGCGSKCGGPVQKCGGPVQKSCGPTQKCFGPMQKSCGPMQKCFGPMQKSCGPMQKCFGPMQKSCGPMQKRFAPMQKSCGPTQKCFGPMQKSCGPTQKCFGPMQKCGGPVQKCDGPTQKCGIGASQKGFALWAPKAHHACGPKCGPKWHFPTTTCAPACGKGCGMPKGCGCGLFGRLHFGHGCGCGHAKGGCGSMVVKGGCGKGGCGGGKAIHGSPIKGDMPVPAEVTEEPTVPTPAPLVPPTPEKSARRLYSLFN
jgi:hypothetical protein